jgi:hypothetical protein
MKHYNWEQELEKQKVQLEDKGYRVLYLAVYGSQNYNLDEHSDDYTSDFDTKAVILPSLEDLVKGRSVSEVLNTEVGQCDVKDVRSFFQVLVKGNAAYLEVMCTNYKYLNPDYAHLWTWTDDSFEKFFRAVFPSFAKASYGMALQKQKALTHPYPGVLDELEKYGYSGKQLHHIVRLFDLFVETQKGLTFKDALKQTDNNKVEVLMNLKTHRPNLTVEEATKLAADYVGFFKHAVDQEMSKNCMNDLELVEKVKNMGDALVTRAVYDEVLS